MVLVKEDNLPVCSWIIGRIQDTILGSDGQVRVVLVRTPQGLFKRSISNICLLPYCYPITKKKMKEFTRRKSSRNSKQNVLDASPYTGRSRSISTNENTSQTRHSRSASANENASQRKRKHSPPSSVEQLKVRKRMVNGRVLDAYCWVCHKLGSESICNLCPRVYHQHCLEKIRNLNQSPACECYMKRVDGKNEDLELQNLELQVLLRTVMQEALKENKKSEPKGANRENEFCRLFQQWTIESEMLSNIMDLSIIIDKMNGERPYSSSGQFFLDVKWIYHNCCILYGFESKITNTALKLEKNFKLELMDMEACPECYTNAYCDEYITHAAFFTNVCRNDHEIVWAQLRGSPYWPAKLMNIHNGHAEVRFFGTHDKANVPIKKCYKISKDPPLKRFVSQAKYMVAKTELSMYVSNYEVIKRRPFPYYPADTPLEDNYAGAKKHYRKNQRWRVTGAKRVSGKESSPSNHGTQEEPDSGTRSAETQGEHDSGTGRMGNSRCNESEDSSKSLVLGDTKVKYIRHFVNNRSNQNLSECAKSPISSHPKVMCEMTFTAEHNEPVNELANENECMDNSTHHYSSSQTSLNPNLSLIPVNRTTDVPGEFLAGTDVQNAGDFVNVNPLSAFSSILSSNEIPSTSACVDLNTPSSLPVITSVSACNNSDYIAESSIFPHEQMSVESLINDINNSLGCIEPSSSDNMSFDLVDNEADDIQVINEKKRKSADECLKDKSVLKALVEMIVTSNPKLREGLKAISAFTLHSILVMWLEMHTSKYSHEDLKEFSEICSRFIKKIKYLQKTNSELKNEIEILTEEVKKLKDDSNNKEHLRDCIIKMTSQKILQTKVKELETCVEEEKIARLELVKDNELLRFQLEEANRKIEEQDQSLIQNMKIQKDLEEKTFKNYSANVCASTQT